MKKLDAEEKLSKCIFAHFTQGEGVALKLLGTDHYESQSHALRRALALLVNTQHPDLKKYLRKDLTESP